MARFYATKKEGESSDKMLVRFKKLLFGSRMINNLRATRYNFKQDTKRKTREKAIICSKYRELNEDLS
jgi:ribosomal protein S21